MVSAAHHAVAEAIGRHAEFEGHKQVINVRPEDCVATEQYLADDPGITNSRQKVPDDDPLIVPAQNSARFLECMALGRDGVMGAQKGNMQLRDNQILIVTLVADQHNSVVLRSAAARLARQIVRFVWQWRIPINAGNEPHHHP